MDYDVIIIGAGVGGLFAGLKLSSQGKKVLIVERQPVPGGYATTFKRKGFIFEAAVHCVDGLAKDGPIRNFLEETGVASRVEFIELKHFGRMIYPRHDFIADFNCGNFTDFLKANFPQEKESINRLFREMDRFYAQFDEFSSSCLPLWIKLIAAPFRYPLILQISGDTLEKFISRYIQDERLKAIITDIWRFLGLPPKQLSALYFLLAFRGYYYSPTAYIKGGFVRLFEAMVEEIKNNGSRVMFNTTVKKIVTGRAKSVRAVVTDKGEEFTARLVISNADAITTLTQLVDNESIQEEYCRILSSQEKSISAVQLYLGLDVPAKNLGMNEFMFSINTGYSHEDTFCLCLGNDYDNRAFSIVDHSQIDPSLVPAGKGSLLIMILDSYLNWKDLGADEYKAKKQVVADKLIMRASSYLPGLKGHIESMEVATPRTMQRYTLSSDGAIYGFASNVKQSGINRLAQETKIKGLFLAGAWTQPGCGVHGCFVSGLNAADLALKFLA